MRYRLRTLLILLAIGPPWLAVWFWGFPKTMLVAVGSGVVMGLGFMFLAAVTYRWLATAGLAPRPDDPQPKTPSTENRP